MLTYWSGDLKTIGCCGLGAIVIQMKFDVIMDLLKRRNWISSVQMMKFYNENVKHRGFF